MEHPVKNNVHHVHLYLIILIPFFVSQISAQQIWMKTYGGDQLDQALSTQQTNDGGYIVVGGTNSFGHGLEDIWLIKLDKLGDTLWTKTFGGSNDDKAYYVQQTMDHGYIFTGYTKSYGYPGMNVILAKTDSSGNSLWVKILGDVNRNWALSVQQTVDLGYIVVGFTQINSTNQSVIWLIKTNSDGVSIWTKSYSVGDMNWAGSVRQTDDEGYILAGFTETNNSRDALLIKTDLLGDTLWTKTYGGPFYDWIRDLHQTSDGGYLLTGVTQSDSTNGQDVWLLKTDLNGEVIFSKTFGGSLDDWAYSCAVQDKNQGYVITGGTYSFGNGDADAWLIKTNLLGDTIWTKTYGGVNHDFASSISKTQDNGFIIAGGTSSFGAGDSDVWVLKTDSTGNTQLPPNDVSESGNVPDDYFLSQNFPNPFNSSTQFNYQLSEPGFVILKIFDPLGKEIETLVKGLQEANTYTVHFNALGLPSGVYFYSLIVSNKYLITRKMIYLK